MRDTFRNTRGEVCELRFLPLEDAERPDLVLETLIQHLLNRVLEGHPRPMLVSLQLHPPGFDRPYVIPLWRHWSKTMRRLWRRHLNDSMNNPLPESTFWLAQPSPKFWLCGPWNRFARMRSVEVKFEKNELKLKSGACALDDEHHVSNNVQSLVRIVNPDDRHCLARSVLIGLRDLETRMANGGGRDAFTAYAQRQDQHRPEALTLLRRAGLPVNKDMYTLEDVEQLQQWVNNEHGVGQSGL
ncbi:hypothetical protein niasHT_002569 [Heterodera trifolii]|uniref:Uncharacterized protein n=1 Tax=Heterodera trifolii TaxID=157864 RepID=A0ABD2LTZ6_9BILA